MSLTRYKPTATSAFVSPNGITPFMQEDPNGQWLQAEDMRAVLNELRAFLEQVAASDPDSEWDHAALHEDSHRLLTRLQEIAP